MASAFSPTLYRTADKHLTVPEIRVFERMAWFYSRKHPPFDAAQKQYVREKMVLLNLALYPDIFGHYLKAKAFDDKTEGHISPAIYEEFLKISVSPAMQAFVQAYDPRNPSRTGPFFDLSAAKAEETSTQFINALDISDAAKEYALNALKTGGMEESLRYCRQAIEICDMKFMEQWARGEFTYKPSVFKNREELTVFCAKMTYRLFSYFPSPYTHDLKAHMRTAGTKLFERLLAREQELWKMEADRQVNADAQAKAARDLAEKQKELALKRQAELIANPQPHNYSNESLDILGQLSLHSQTTASNSKNAARLLDIVRDAHGMLDVRDSKVQELGDILFSTYNLTTAAKAFGLEKQAKNFRSDHAFIVGSQSIVLSNLYKSSPEVRHIVDTLMQQDDGILLLATLLRDEQRSKNYAAYRMQSRPALTALRQDVDTKAAALHGLTREETLKDFAEDTEVVNFKTARNNLATKIRQTKRARKDLEAEIRQVLQGHEPAASAALPIIEAGTDTLQPGWLSTLKEEGFRAEATPHRKFFRVCSIAYPHLHFDIKNSDAEGFNRGLSTLRILSSQHEPNVKLSNELVNECGFIENDAAKTLCHPEYGIEISSVEDVNLPQALCKARERFEAEAFKQEAMMGSIRRTGIVIESSNTPHGGQFTLRHPEFGSVQVAQRGYFREEDFASTQQLLNRIIAKQSAQTSAAPARNLPAKSKTVPGTIWTPEPGQTMLLYDSTTLKNLSATRKRMPGNNWLDLIECSSSLPNVMVMVPSRIADWEMQGRIPVFDASGKRKGFEQIDERFDDDAHPLYASHMPVRQLLKTAARARLTPDGHFIMEPRTDKTINPNLIVIDLPGDRRELYDTLHQIHQSPKHLQTQRTQEVSQGHHHGDNALTELAQALPANVGAIIISDDFDYFQHHAPHTTDKGMPIGHASTTSYLEAEFAAHAPDLRSSLGEKEALTLSRVIDEIKEYWVQHNDDERILQRILRPYSTSGRHASPKQQPAHKISDIIRSGVNKSIAETAPRVEEKSSSAKAWTDPDLRKKTQARPIDPARVDERPNQSAGPNPPG